MALVARCRSLLAPSHAQQRVVPLSVRVAHLTTSTDGSDWSDFNAVVKVRGLSALAETNDQWLRPAISGSTT